MSNINYPAKTVAGGGGTEYQEGNSLPAAELQGDFDAIATVVNGDLDEDNLSGGTQIPNSKLAEIAPTKVGDYWSSAAEAAAVTSPGDSATITSSPATDLTEELERLRYRIEALGGHRSGTTYRASTGSDVGTAWVEPPIRGANLIANSGFEVFTGATGDAPDGWTESGTIATSVVEVPANPSTGLEKRSLAMTTDAVGEGVSQQVGGLKASKKYVMGVRYLITSGTWAFTATGGLASGDYQNCSIEDSTTGSVRSTSFIVQTATTGAPLTLGISETTGSGDINLIEAWMFELDDDYPAAPLTFPTQEVSVSTEINASSSPVPTTVNSSTDWTTNWTDIPDLDIAQYVPTQGLRMIYEVSIAWASELNDSQAFYGFRLELDDGSTSIVDGPYIEATDTFGGSEVNQVSTARLSYVLENPTPGTTYTFTPQVTAADSAGSTGRQPRLHPLVAITAGGASSAGSNSALQTTSRARLRVERI